MKNFESTYALLIRSEEKSRSALETVVYALFILCVVFSIWHVAHQPMGLPIKTINTSAAVMCDTTVARG